MKRLLHPNQVPPGGYVWKDPDTGVEFKGIVFSNVFSQAVAHRRANRLDVPGDFQNVMLEQMCARWPKGWCSEDGKPTPVPGKSFFTVDRLKAGSRALLQLVRGRYASPETMRARAAVCRTCPARVSVEGCFSCGGIAKIAAQALGKDRDQQALALIRAPQEVPTNRVGCNACGCYLPAKVWLRGDENLKSVTPDARAKLPPTCWLFREGLK